MFESNFRERTMAEYPIYLYKIISKENWIKSQNCKFIQLSDDDSKFIHLATKEQLNRIIEKFWSKDLNYVVLKLKVCDLAGKLVLEANPCGVNKYYHLYQGSILLCSVVEIL